MLLNYVKIGFRNLLKNRLFSLINISGMAISITIFMVITLFLADELKFDRDLKDVSMKFRVYSTIFYDDGRVDKGAMIPPPVAPALASEFPEVEYYTRFLNFNSRVLFEGGDKKLTEDGGGYADHTIFSMFALHLIEGDSATALTTPGSVAISETLANKIFGTEPALGKIIEVLNSPYSVTAVFSDFPVHSHLHLNYLLPMVEFTAGNKERMESRSWNQFHTYIKLKPGADPRQLEAKLMDFAERFAKPSKNPRIKFDTYHLMGVDDIYLQAYDQKWDISARGNAQTVYILSATAGFILLIAILNFINLSTARAVNRVKEVGVRKVMGAFRRQLVGQFISESVLVTFIALVIAGAITEVLLPSLNSFTGKNIPTQLFFNPVIVSLMGLSALAIGIAAGVYPAFYVSHGKPAEILSGKNQGKLSGRTLLRKVLVVFQFMLSFALITGSLIVTGQNTYLRTRDMGFDQQNLVVLPLRDELRQNKEFTKNSFMAHPNVLSATMGYGLPGQAFAGDGVKDMVTRKNYSTSMLTVDHDYIKTLGLTVVAGRDFSTDFPSDEKNAFILSETAVKMLGHTSPEQAIGHELEWDRWDNHDSLKVGKVVGVVKDIHLNSLRENVTPVILQIFPFAYSTITLRIKKEDIPATITHLEQTWKKFNSEWPFEYKFLDENFDRLYKSEEKLATLFTFFTVFAIFVACLGLFGLVVFSTMQKYREISIRKVLGASEASLVFQLASSYIALIAIAFVIAAPLAYAAAENWLQGFAYHIDVSPFLLLKAALSILMISLLTVGIQSVRAAKANPVEALRRE